MATLVHSIPSISFLSSLTLQPLKIKTHKKALSTSRSEHIKTLTCITSKPNNKSPTKDGRKPTSKKTRKSSYGSSRRSILKKTFIQEQVTFTSQLSSDPHVGIIGGGMAGLLCASSLEKRGVKSTVFDTVGQLFPFSTLFSIWVSFLVLCGYFVL